MSSLKQIGDGAYGEDEETTLSRGEQLIIHLYKDTQCYSGVSETGDEINIPLNSPHELYVHYEKSLEGYETPAKLGSVFPLKYKAVRIKSSLKNASDSSQTIEEGERLKALYFDKEMENLVCLDKQGCEVTFEMNQLSEIRAIERTEDPLFMLEAHQRFSLPFDVQFVQKSNSSAHLPRGIIRLKRIAVRQTIIATSPSEYSKSVLTFPSTLGVTVTPPEDAMLSSPGYKNLCENLKIGGGDLTKVEETIENDNEVILYFLFLLLLLLLSCRRRRRRRRYCFRCYSSCCFCSWCFCCGDCCFCCFCCSVLAFVVVAVATAVVAVFCAVVS